MKFNAIEWVRKVRDGNYENCKNMRPKEKIEYTRKIAKNFIKSTLEKIVSENEQKP